MWMLVIYIFYKSHFLKKIKKKKERSLACNIVGDGLKKIVGQ